MMRIPATVFAVLALTLPSGAQDPAGHRNTFGEVYWVPTYGQALEMAGATGRPIFLMGYSLVGDGSTYTAVTDDSCKGVF